jgi:hypothetical protein
MALPKRLPSKQAADTVVIVRVGVFGLLDTGVNGDDGELVGIRDALEEESEFLAGGEWFGVSADDTIEGWQNAEHALRFFLLELAGSPCTVLFRSLVLRVRRSRRCALLVSLRVERIGDGGGIG